MKRILLVGKADTAFSELDRRLSEHYTVRFGSSEPLAVLAILKSFRPHLLIVRYADTRSDMLTQLKNEHGDIPVIAVTDNGGDDIARASEVCPDDVQSVCDAVYRVMPFSEEDDNEPTTVMVIDDDAAMLRMVKAMLDIEFPTILAPSGLKALKLLERRKADVILLDCEMPEMNGIETFQRLRADERFADIPVIFLTGNASSEIIERITEMGAAGYLIKPADAPDIKAAIGKALNKN